MTTAADPEINALDAISASIEATKIAIAAREARLATLQTEWAALESQRHAEARVSPDAYRALAIALTDKRTMIEHCELLLQHDRDELAEFERQCAVAEHLLKQQAFRALVAANTERGKRIDALLGTVAAEISAAFDGDNAADRMAQELGLPRNSPFGVRCHYATSRGLLTDAKVLHAFGSDTSVELSVTYARHRSGLTFETIARHPGISALDAESPVLVASDGSVLPVSEEGAA